jgi:hypothetical protein
MAVRLSALSVGRASPLKKIPGTHFCYKLTQSQDHNAAGRFRQVEKTYDIGIEVVTFRLVA